MRKIRFWSAAALAFIMGIPMATEAKAQDTGGIIGSALGLAFGIVDVAGSS